MAGPGPTDILPTHTPELFQVALNRVAEALRAGEVVAVPTETVYGLAANACAASNVAKIYEVKGRPANNPLIVHIAGLAMAQGCVGNWPAIADSLAAAFWPGPLTLVLPKSNAVPEIVTAGGTTVALRWPSHPFMQRLIERCGFPLAAPSANTSNRLSPTCAEDVLKDLGGRIRLIVDGGRSQVGIESTVLDLTVNPPRILRPGMLDRNAIASVVGRVAVGRDPRDAALKSPGMMEKHYAPRARLLVAEWRDRSQLEHLLHRQGVPRGKIHLIVHSQVPDAIDAGRVAVIPSDAPAFARALYAELRRCDDEGAQLIIVEAPPASLEWEGIADRLQRASS